jgi:hypothetical protein
MISCSQCGAANREESSFCTSCGYPLAVGTGGESSPTEAFSSIGQEPAPAPVDEPVEDEPAEQSAGQTWPSPGPGEEEARPLPPPPAWVLAARSGGLEAGRETAAPGALDEGLEGTGLLAGIRGVLPVEGIIAGPHLVVHREGAILPPPPWDVAAVPGTESPEARLFAEVVALPLAAEPTIIARQTARTSSLVPRWIAYALLLVAVAAPFFLAWSPLPYDLAPTRAVSAAGQEIDRLPRGAAVLLAFDYDPATAGEMDVVAAALVSHLMDRQARLVTVSLMPTGPATADALIARAAAGRAAYGPAGPLYANLGFLPGQATGARLIGQGLSTALPYDFSGVPAGELPVMSGITGTLSFDLMIELAAGSDTLRWWIEQVATPSGVPLVAGVSALVDPVARPYFEMEAPQLKGIVGGVIGAAEYQLHRSGQPVLPRSLAARLDSQLAAQIVLIGVLIAGNIVYLARRALGRE